MLDLRNGLDYWLTHLCYPTAKHLGTQLSFVNYYINTVPKYFKIWYPSTQVFGPVSLQVTCTSLNN